MVLVAALFCVIRETQKNWNLLCDRVSNKCIDPKQLWAGLGEGREQSYLNHQSNTRGKLSKSSGSCSLSSLSYRGFLAHVEAAVSEILAVKPQIPCGEQSQQDLRALPRLCGYSVERKWFYFCQSHPSPMPSSPWLLDRLVPEEIKKMSGFLLKKPQITQEAEG